MSEQISGIGTLGTSRKTWRRLGYTACQPQGCGLCSRVQPHFYIRDVYYKTPEIKSYYKEPGTHTFLPLEEIDISLQMIYTLEQLHQKSNTRHGVKKKNRLHVIGPRIFVRSG